MQFHQSDEMISQVKALMSLTTKAPKPKSNPTTSKPLFGEVIKPINVPELPAGFKFDPPKVDATARLNPVPMNWTLPKELLKKHQPVYNIGVNIRLSELLNRGENYLGQVVTVQGWIKTARDQKNLIFIQVNDGTCASTLQIVVDPNARNFAELTKANTGFSIKATGLIIKSPAAGQLIEMAVNDPNAHHVVIVGAADPEKYPMAKGFQKVETLRTIAHLRPRGNFFSAVTRVRNNLAYATHVFFQSNGCLYIHTPIITASDCEGAGEMFQVTTLLKDGKIDKVPHLKNGDLDYTQDFFEKQANLTVSGQLQVEHFCISMSNVYTFGPTFRAEASHTHRHLCEFWMIEPEFAFADLYDNMDAAEAYVKFCINFVLENNMDDLKFLDKQVKNGIIDYLKDIVSNDFVRCSYTQGIEILTKAVQMGAKFEQNQIEWGMDLKSEHERFLAEKVFKRPVFLYDYPKKIKAFYMKVSQDGNCVRAMDMLIPQVGELIGGSQREERYDVLVDRIKECNLKVEDYAPYLDLRRYGTVPHAGFGLGFERLVMMVTGVENIRDVIPFPRAHKQAEF